MHRYQKHLRQQGSYPQSQTNWFQLMPLKIQTTHLLLVLLGALALPGPQTQTPHLPLVAIVEQVMELLQPW